MYRRVLCYAGLAIAIPALLLANSGHDPVKASIPQAVLAKSGTPDYPLVQRVDCGKGFGTAFRVDHDTMVSAAHVTALGPCKIRGKSYQLTEQNGALDFSTVHLEGAGHIRIDCGGYIPGRWYYAVGYANAAPWQTIVPIYATVLKHDLTGQRILRNMVIPGMSGGPVLSDQGAVVGIVNARNADFDVSFSRELKDTSLCK